MNKLRNTITLFICIIALNVQAQYLRDNTKYHNLEKYKSQNDSLVFSCYSDDQIYPLTLHSTFNIPEINVEFGQSQFPLFLDFGNSDNITITNNIADYIDFIVADTGYTYTPEGKIRGIRTDIVLESIAFLDKEYEHHKGALINWNVFSTEPTNGIVGLNYFQNQCITLSYKEKLLAVSESPFPIDTLTGSSDFLNLLTIPQHPYGLFLEGFVNNTEALIYLDSGKNYSEINRTLVADNLIVSDKSGSFYNGAVTISFGDVCFDIYYPRVKTLQRNTNSELPMGIDIGSDILKHFTITIDRTENRNLIIFHK